MYLMKKKYFYFLAFLVLGLMLGYSVWGYFALMNHGGYQSYEIKYIAECFIFSALLLITLLGGVFIFISHRSTNVYRELDKIHDLFASGNYYTQNSFNKLGTLGDKILKINRHLVQLNDIKTKKISSDSKIINLLLNHSVHEMLIFKTTGIVTKASKAFLTKNGVNKEDIIDKSIDSIVQKFEFTNIVADLARGQHVSLKRRMFFDSEDKTGVIKYMVFFPIFNITDDFSAAVCIFVSEGKFNKYNQMKKNPESEEDNVYKSSTMMRRIAELFTPEE